MNRLSLKLLVLLFLLFFCFSDAVARIEYRVVKTRGKGLTEKKAIYDALKGALEQVNGLQMSAKEKSSLESMFREVDGQKSEISEEKFQQKVTTATKGTVKQYEILSAIQDPSMDGQWIVSLESTIAKYITSQQVNRIRLAVIPFKVNQFNSEQEIFAEQITQNLVSYLTQTRRFAMLDRENSIEQQRELDFLKREDVPVEEMARIGNKIGTDFIVVGRIDKLTCRTSSVTLRRMGEKVFSSTCDVSVSYRVIDIATGQILGSDSYVYRKRVNGSSCDYSGIAQKAAASFGRKITESIFPIAVVAVRNGFVTLGQGGNTIRVGQNYNLIEYGDDIYDPNTGESLGQEEIPVGLIKIVSVQAKISRAKIIKSNVDIDKYFEPGRYIVRVVNVKQTYKKNPVGLSEKTGYQSRESSGNSRRKIINKDDW